MVFLEKRHFFDRKFTKIAENCDQNIDPWLILTQNTSLCAKK
jgi:hypothetical protein